MRERFAYNHLSVSFLCKHYRLTRQGFYKSRSRRLISRLDREKLYMLVMEARRELPREGCHKLYKRILPKLQKMGIKIGRDGLFKFLRQEGLLVKPKRSFVKTTNSYHRFYTYSNLIESYRPTGVNQVWVSDITYIRTYQGFMYLALITDAYSRKIVGYDISNNLELTGCIKALKKALNQLPGNHQLIHHSDRGLQYCSSVYQNELEKCNITPSMTDGYDCYQNALAERINGILKGEFFMHTCNTAKELKRLIKESITTYNNKRPHLSLNYKTPNFIHNKKSCEASFTGFS